LGIRLSEEVTLFGLDNPDKCARYAAIY
jgi:hypothetical protein